MGNILPLGAKIQNTTFPKIKPRILPEGNIYFPLIHHRAFSKDFL
jgi:hypothetical protein